MLQVLQYLLSFYIITELPKPTSVTFDEHHLRVTVWFDFCGQFTNMVYVFSSVSDICADDDADNDDRPSQLALAHLAYVRFESVVFHENLSWT